MRILIAEDDPVSLQILELTLKNWGYDVVVARDGCEALQFIESDETPKMLILDWMMPGLDGPDICRHMRSNPKTSGNYVLLLTARGECRDLVEGLEAGADDYVSKPFVADELKARLQVGRRIVALQEELTLRMQELETANLRLSELSFQDGLTGVANRRRLDEMFDLEWKRAAREGKPLGFLLLDIDRFKLYNDHFGHPMGDACIKSIAWALKNSIKRAGDLVARYGGEEFAILLPRAKQDGLVEIAEKVRLAVGNLRIPHPAVGRNACVTVSIGGACCYPRRGFVPQMLVEMADRALYGAKERGRNCCQVTPREDWPEVAGALLAPLLPNGSGICL
jgi:diguanylate cyclase (GGDEF)-like protein